MKFAVFVTIWSAGVSTGDLESSYANEPLAFLKQQDAVQSVEFYTPEPGDVPKLDDIPAPDLIVQIDVDDLNSAQALTESDKFKKLFLDKTAQAAPIEKINLEILQPVNYALPGQESAEARTAPFSFVVRYYGPVNDLAQFVDFYTTNHPPILAKFPGIKNVFCYLPVDWEAGGKIKDDSIVIGNEVVFEDLDTFKKALATDVLKEAMADAELFQEYGYSTHHAMHREFVYQR